MKVAARGIFYLPPAGPGRTGRRAAREMGRMGRMGLPGTLPTPLHPTPRQDGEGERTHHIMSSNNYATLIKTPLLRLVCNIFE